MEPTPPSAETTAPDADTDRLPVVTPPQGRRPAHKSRKFWCVIALTLIPPVNHLTIQMPLEGVLATMFPWAAWGGGEWGLDITSLAKRLGSGDR